MSLNNEEGFRLCLDCRKFLPTSNCWSRDQGKKHFMNGWEIQKHLEPGCAIELEAYKNLATNEHFTELITRFQLKSLLVYSVPHGAPKPKVLAEHAIQLASCAHIMESRVLGLIH